MKSKIQRPLSRAGVLCTEALPGPAADRVLDAANQVAVVVKQLPPRAAAAAKATLALTRLVSRGMLEKPAVNVFAYFNWFFILVDVSDAERGLSIIMAELDRADLLRHSEIALCGAAETPGEYRLWHGYPPGGGKSFVRHLSLFLQLERYGENLLKGENQ